MAAGTDMAAGSYAPTLLRGADSRSAAARQKFPPQARPARESPVAHPPQSEAGRATGRPPRTAVRRRPTECPRGPGRGQTDPGRTDPEGIRTTSVAGRRPAANSLAIRQSTARKVGRADPSDH